MKKFLALALALLALLSLSACGGGSKPLPPLANPSAPATPSVGSSGAGAAKKTPVGASASGSKVPAPVGGASAAPGGENGIDVDLTRLSSTMVYSEVYNMVNHPQDYVGKKVKMNGAFSLYCQRTDESGNPDFSYPIYYACVIADATACCSQGIEFVPEGDFSYPDDFPALGTTITVTGTFQTYEEDGAQYCHLVNAQMNV